MQVCSCTAIFSRERGDELWDAHHEEYDMIVLIGYEVAILGVVNLT